MIPPDYSGGNCANFSIEEMEGTFFYPGPHDTRRPPVARAQERWNEAKEVCIECPIFLRCREDNWGQTYGVWGGTDQYERHLERRKRSRAAQAMNAEQRSALAAQISARYAGGLGEAAGTIARRTGYSVMTVNALLAEHADTLPKKEERVYGVFSPQERELLAGMAAKGTAMRVMAAALGRGKELLAVELAALDVHVEDAPAWPTADPEGDAWVWHHNLVRSANYVGQTADGAWLFMGLRGKAQTRRWLPAQLVQLRVKVTPVITEWAGRPSESAAA